MIYSEKELNRRLAILAKRLSDLRLKSLTHLNSGTFPDPRQSERKWMCFSTALAEVWLMLYCENTGAHGVVKNPSSEEWSWAFDCPSDPKHWPDASRVTLMKEDEQ